MYSNDRGIVGYLRVVQILDSLPALVGYVDLDLRIVYANKLIEAWYQRPLDELIGMQLKTLFSVEHYQTVEALLRQVLAGTEVDEEREIQYPDGETRHVHLNYIPDRSDDQVLGYFFLVQDVTERNRAQEALRAINADLDRRIGDATAELAYRNQELSKENRAREESEERYRIVSELMSDLIYVYDVDDTGAMRLIWHTGRLSQEFGPGIDASDFRFWRPITHKDDLHILDRRIKTLLSNKSSIDEFRVIDADGHIRWLRIYGRPQFDRSLERVTRIIVAAQDITEAREAQDALDQQRARLHHALDSMSDGFMLFDAEHRLVEFNQQVVQMFPQSGQRIGKGQTFKDIIARSVSAGEVISNEVAPEQWIEERLSSFPNIDQVHDIELSGGRWVRSTDRETADGGVVSIRTDITDGKRSEAQRQKNEAELAHVLRRASMGEMASALAHELSQPLAVIVNYANGLVRRLDTEQYPPADLITVLAQIRDAGERSKEIISHVRDFVSRGQPPSQKESLQEIVQDVNQLLQSLITQHNVRIEMQFPDGGAEVLVSRIEIEQVVFNLLKNSIDSFALSGTKSPLIQVVVNSINGRFYEVLVKDNGPGIDRAVADDIFKPYVTNKPTGLGMGLSISQTIIEGHGGRLSLIETDEPGCCFRFTLSRFQHD
jgi:PAS domain S-box-containing protein